MAKSNENNIDRPELPEGWGYIDIAHKGSFSATEDGKRVFEVEGPVWLPVPMTEDAARDALSGFTHRVETPDGKQTLEGAPAVYVAQYKQCFESFRGTLRQDAVKAAATGSEMDADAIRHRVLTWEYGQKRSRTVEVSETDIRAAVESGNYEDVVRLLQQQGARVS